MMILLIAKIFVMNEFRRVFYRSNYYLAKDGGNIMGEVLRNDGAV